MPSFDVVCEIDLQEVDNAINQTLREVANRFDFRGQRTEVRREEHVIHLLAQDDFKVRALTDMLQEKLVRRNVPPQGVTPGEPEPGPAGTAKRDVKLQQGIEIEKAREIVKLV